MFNMHPLDGPKMQGMQCMIHFIFRGAKSDFRGVS